MAWDDFETDDGQGWTGDKPIDEFSSCLSRIAQAYRDRLGRKPRLIEVLQARPSRQRLCRWLTVSLWGL